MSTLVGPCFQLFLLVMAIGCQDRTRDSLMKTRKLLGNFESLVERTSKVASRGPLDGRSQMSGAADAKG